MVRARRRNANAPDTRELILATAERLFAEHGVAAVSNRQISGAAGQANNSAVGYHFGTKEDLVLAIVRHHAPAIEQRRVERLVMTQGSTALRDWLACLVLPHTDHFAALDSPSWYARFLAQAMTDPVLRRLVIDEAVASTSMRTITERLSELLPVLPEEVIEERGDMSRLLIVHVCAERERALEEGTATPRPTWAATAVGLIDALLGLWQAPCTPSDRSPGDA